MNSVVITGASCGFVSACSSSSHALGYAFDEIALGRQERILVVAAEDGDAESLLPFTGLRALSTNRDPDTASRPFDCQRDGFVGTGGGAALVLESTDSAARRGAVPGNAALTEPDPACDGLQLPTRTEPADLRLVLNNSSGFGGANVCHLFARP